MEVHRCSLFFARCICRRAAEVPFMNRATITAATNSAATQHPAERGSYGRSSLRIRRSARVGACIGAALLLTMPQIASANKKSSALPAAVYAAKTIYIDNQTNVAELQDAAYMGLAKWGHFELVDSAQKADMVLRLTGSGYAQIVPSDTPPDMSAKP